MNPTAIFWPMFFHAVLVFGVYVMLGLRRKQAVQAKSATISQFRENASEPPESIFVRNNLANQFELPMLFHAVCLALYATAGIGLVPVILAWIFTVSRYAHTFVHVTSNRIRYRQPLFTLGFLMVAALWIWLAVHLL